MKGYLQSEEKNRQALIERSGSRWYVSGDKGYLDSDGFLFIVDRYSRFAKLGGEMISLGEVEKAVRAALTRLAANDDMELLAVAVPDTKKGEKVVLLCERSLELSDLRSVLIESGVNPLLIPAKILVIEQIPKLGSGKTDYSEAKRIAGGI